MLWLFTVLMLTIAVMAFATAGAEIAARLIDRWSYNRWVEELHDRPKRRS